MTQVQDMTYQQLNKAIAELLGHKVGRKVDFGFKPEYDRDVIVLENDRHTSMPNFCGDPATSLELQAKAIEVDAKKYGINLARLLEWDNDSDPLSYSDNDLFSYNGVAVFLQATPRQMAEAAYITLSSQEG